MDEQGRARIEQFQRLVQLDPDGEISHYGLAKAYFDCGTLADGRGDRAEALKLFQEAIREYGIVLTIKPDYAACFLFLGLSLQNSGSLEPARRVYEEGMIVAQKNGDLHLRKRMWDQVQILDGKAASPPPPAAPGRPPETGPQQVR
jgi:tetratricopeptide (TPR) repeat protein